MKSLSIFMFECKLCTQTRLINLHQTSLLTNSIYQYTLHWEYTYKTPMMNNPKESINYIIHVTTRGLTVYGEVIIYIITYKIAWFVNRRRNQCLWIIANCTTFFSILIFVHYHTDIHFCTIFYAVFFCILQPLLAEWF